MNFKGTANNGTACCLSVLERECLIIPVPSFLYFGKYRGTRAVFPLLLRSISRWLLLDLSPYKATEPMLTNNVDSNHAKHIFLAEANCFQLAMIRI